MAKDLPLSEETKKDTPKLPKYMLQSAMDELYAIEDQRVLEVLQKLAGCETPSVPSQRGT